MTTVRRTLDFPSNGAKARYIDFWARVEAHSEPVRALARRFMHLPLSERAAAIHAHIRDSVGYQRDPGHREELADSGVVLSRLYDDCDGKQRLFVAVCRAAGIDARIVPVHTGTTFSHVQGEVRWPGSQAHPRANADGWLRVEIILDSTPLGAGTETMRRGPDGAPVYAGPRTVAPTGTFPAKPSFVGPSRRSQPRDPSTSTP